MTTIMMNMRSKRRMMMTMMMMVMMMMRKMMLIQTMMMTTVVLPVANECLQRAEGLGVERDNIRKGVKSDTNIGKGRE